jgi:hypothetical protein
MNCRHCRIDLVHRFLDLGFSPPSNSYLAVVELSRPEKYFPLRVRVCERCWLVQTEDFAQADELFRADYAYFSSTSRSWMNHALHYCRQVISQFSLGPNSHVVEVASNDGYLLRNFVAAGIPCLGVEPTAGTAAAAEAQGIPVLREFFGEALACRLAEQGYSADLLVGNNVYAHVPDINDFTRGIAALLKTEGVVTLEFPHLLQLIRHTQFDTVYHEHFSYLSLVAVQRIFAAAGLRVWDVEELPTHGGSLRVYGCRAASTRVETDRVKEMLSKERAGGLERVETFTTFQSRADKVKDDLLMFLIEHKRAGKRVAAYGAAAKGSTLLNYAGIKSDLLLYVCDAAPSKQGKYMPGSHIPILSPEALRVDPPDCVLILPWNLSTEVSEQLSDLVSIGVKLVTAVPEVKAL